MRPRELPARVGRARAARDATRGSARARGSSRSTRRKTLGLPVVGYLAYDYARRAGADGTACRRRDGFPRAASSSRTRSSASTTAPAWRRCSPAIRTRSPDGWRAGSRGSARPAGTSALIRRSPDRARYEEMVRIVKEHIVAGDAFQIVPSQRAERPTSASPLDVYRALRRVNPSPYLFLLELDGIALVGSSPERLVACEDGRASLCPIAGTTDADRRRRRAAALVGEGPGRARDARRPRPQRPLARVPRRHRARRTRSWRWSASRTCRTSSPRSSASCARA